MNYIKTFLQKFDFSFILRYLKISFVIFVVIFAALYGDVYFEIFSWRIKESLGLNKPVAQIDSKIELDQAVLLKINKADPKENINLASLNIQITPPDNRIILEKLNKNMPIVNVASENLLKGDSAALEKDILSALENGIVHYPSTKTPGNPGNFVLTGHSSYYSWAKGTFKDAFASMHNMEVGDRIIVYYDQQKYIYEIFDKKIVMPEEVSVLNQPDDANLLTTITCTPIGTNTKRLIHVAKLVNSR